MPLLELVENGGERHDRRRDLVRIPKTSERDEIRRRRHPWIVWVLFAGERKTYGIRVATHLVLGIIREDAFIRQSNHVDEEITAIFASVRDSLQT